MVSKKVNSMEILKNTGIWIALFLIITFSMLPFFWILSSSFKPTDEIFSPVPNWFTKNPTLQHYKWVFDPSGGNMGKYILNSFAVSIISALIITTIACTGGYALGRFEFPAKNVLGIFILILQMVQGPLVVVFWYRFSWQLGILDTYIALILAYIAINLPFATWLAAGFLSQLPKELEDAAMIDGAGYWKTFYRIIIPLVSPGIMAIIALCFVNAWNDYLFALILTQTEKSKTIQIALFDLLSFFAKSNWGGLMAGGVVTSIPPVILFIFLQKYIVGGMTLGGVKE